jgi:DNA polymerase-3 subunit gamma/tau
MSAEASESLLKIIEEPPSHVRFILCTTKLVEMTDTIRSRCQTHEFRAIYWREIADHLSRIVKEENVTVEEEAINLCARMAGGSMRNALQNLDKLLDYAGKWTATSEMAYSTFGSVSEKALDDLLDQIIGVTGGKPDATEGYRIINSLLLTGVEFRVIHEGIARHLGNLIVACSASAAKDLIMVSDEGKQRLQAQLNVCAKKVKGVMLCLKNLHDARTSVEYGLSPETALQMWFIESVYSLRL